MKKLQLYITVLLMAMSCIISVACDDANTTEEKPTADNAEGAIQLRLPGGPVLSKKSMEKSLYGLRKQVMYNGKAYNSSEDIMRYGIILESADLNFKTVREGLPGELIRFNLLFEGTYTLSITAYDRMNAAIFGGTTGGIEVKQRETTQTTVTIKCLNNCISEVEFKTPCEIPAEFNGGVMATCCD